MRHARLYTARRLYGVLVLLVAGQSLVALVTLYMLRDMTAMDWLLPKVDRWSAIWLIPLSMLVQRLARFAQMLLGGKARFQSVSRKNIIMQALSTGLLAALFVAGVTLPSILFWRRWSLR